jgi:hypothetical protein
VQVVLADLVAVVDQVERVEVEVTQPLFLLPQLAVVVAEQMQQGLVYRVDLVVVAVVEILLALALLVKETLVVLAQLILLAVAVVALETLGDQETQLMVGQGHPQVLQDLL